ncbi:hypothetical protein AOLI_G00220720 [Acnodon oligacanthus]
MYAVCVMVVCSNCIPAGTCKYVIVPKSDSLTVYMNLFYVYIMLHFMFLFIELFIFPLVFIPYFCCRNKTLYLYFCRFSVFDII